MISLKLMQTGASRGFVLPRKLPRLKVESGKGAGPGGCASLHLFGNVQEHANAGKSHK